MEKFSGGHIFKPTLEDISLKRFRLRYNTYDDVYYHHWADSACAAVSKYKGLSHYLFSSSGVERRVDDKTGEAYLACKESVDSARLEWLVDFSACGLVVSSVKAKVRNVTNSGQEGDCPQSDVTFFIQGESAFPLSLPTGDCHTEVHGLNGCTKLCIMASILTSFSSTSQHGGVPVKVLPCAELEDSPLDIIVELMCPRLTDDIYCGEILLGLKYTPENQNSDQPNSPLDLSHVHPCDIISPECQNGSGKLHVHMVEGAGIINELTHKPFNTFVKCELVPDSSGSKKTTPKQSIYPSWTEHFIFQGVSRDHVTKGALEVMLYDHHHIHTDEIIGGVRLCNPIKKRDEMHCIPLTAPCSPRSGCVSPFLFSSTSPSKSPIGVTPSAPHFIITSYNGLDQLSPVSPNVMFQNKKGNSEFNEHTSSRNVQKSLPKSIFHLSSLKKTLSPSISPQTSPRTSPLFGQSKFKGFRRRSFCEERESDFLYWWMEDVGDGESSQWSQMLEREGEWIYHWHCIRYRLRAAYSSC